MAKPLNSGSITLAGMSLRIIASFLQGHRLELRFPSSFRVKFQNWFPHSFRAKLQNWFLDSFRAKPQNWFPVSFRVKPQNRFPKSFRDNCQNWSPTSFRDKPQDCFPYSFSFKIKASDPLFPSFSKAKSKIPHFPDTFRAKCLPQPSLLISSLFRVKPQQNLCSLTPSGPSLTTPISLVPQGQFQDSPTSRLPLG